MKRHLFVQTGRSTVANPLLAAVTFILAIASSVGNPPHAAAQVTAEDYARAEWWLPFNVAEVTASATVAPHWSGSRFWYERQAHDGTEFVVVDARQGTSEVAFDHGRLARALSAAADTAIAASALPVDSINLEPGQGTVYLRIGDSSWLCHPAEYVCDQGEESPSPSAGAVRSPDGRWDAFVSDYDLYLREVETDSVYRVTQDGAQYHGYAGSTQANLSYVSSARSGRILNASVLWSPDSRWLITQKVDERNVHDTYLLQSTPPDGVRPKLYTYRYPLPGDSVLPVAELLVLDVQRMAMTSVQGAPLLAAPSSPLENARVWWSADSKRIYYIEHERGYKEIHLHQVDPRTGRIRTLLSESDTSYIDLNVFRFLPPNVRVLSGGKEILWFSERDGWAQLYLYDGLTGQLKNRVTTGEFVVHDIKHVDEASRLVYFTAAGREEDRDAYFRHLYGAPLDGSELTLLTPEDADHWVRFSPDGQYFLDTYAWGGHVPTTVLRRVSGELVLTVEKADLTALREKGWRWPDRFRAKASDGDTDIYGVIYRPTRFDPARSYPVIDAIYPGPQIIASPLALPGDPLAALMIGQMAAQSIAELGFIVVIVDGKGTPFRSRAFREVSYGNLGDAGGLADHVAALRQLASRYPYMDMERVGVVGHSGGGYASARALLLYPEFYKVAVSAAGNHDQRGYIPVWAESYQGYPVGEKYGDQANADVAENLEGKLLLVHGELDDNVHPALTLQLVNALIEANKDFDLLIMPNRNHRFMSDPYFIRKTWDYFVRHLMDKEPPEYRIRARGG